MKAVQFAEFGGPEVLHVQETPDPVPDPDDVLIAVKATTVNHLDLFQRDGSRYNGPLPFTPGLEAAGVVAQTSHGFRQGARVLTTRAAAAKGGGGYASLIAAQAADLVSIPDGVSFEQAVAAGLASSTAWATLFDLGYLKAGERVLIWAGSSGVGSLAIQFAKHAGAWVATTAGSETKAAELRELGADMVIDYHTQDVGKTLQAAGGVNLVFELVGTTLATSLEACAADARIVLIGNLGGQKAEVDTQAWRLKRVTIIGGGARHTSLANERHILQLIAKGQIKPVIARTLPVEQAAEAHRLLASGEIIGKIVMTHS